MRLRRWHGLAVLAAILASVAAPAAAQDLKAADAFLRKLYSGYTTGRKAPNPTGRDAAAYFAPPLLALIGADRALAAGEAGILDLDPICACQDYDKLEHLNIVLEPAGPGRANAVATFHNSATPTTVQYRLVAVDGQWRIEDISEPGIKNMRRFLADGIASRARDLAE